MPWYICRPEHVDKPRDLVWPGSLETCLATETRYQTGGQKFEEDDYLQSVTRLPAGVRGAILPPRGSAGHGPHLPLHGNN